MKWPFKRDRSVDVVPQEIQQYYENENRERTGMVWFLGVGTFLVVGLVMFGLFMGGRWAYEQLAGNKSEVITTKVSQEVSSTSTDESTESSATAPNVTSSPSPTTTNQAQSNSSQTQPRNVAAATTSTNNLPNTGPTETLALFGAVTVLAGAAHYTITTKVRR